MSLRGFLLESKSFSKAADCLQCSFSKSKGTTKERKKKTKIAIIVGSDIKYIWHGMMAMQLSCGHQLLVGGNRSAPLETILLLYYSIEQYYTGQIWSVDGGKLRGRKKPRP